MGRLGISRRGQLALGAVLATAALGLTGCSGAPLSADEADLEAGKQSFVANCGACHVLEDAGTEGRIGPNLDDAFRGSRQQGFEDSAFAGVVRQWILLPQPPMAANIVTGVEADNVSAYVASVAGLSPDSEIRTEAPFVIRPPVPGGEAPADDPPVLQEGEKIAGQEPVEEEAEEGEGG